MVIHGHCQILVICAFHLELNYYYNDKYYQDSAIKHLLLRFQIMIQFQENNLVLKLKAQYYNF